MSKANSIPGGGMPPTGRGPDGKLTRRDLHMKKTWTGSTKPLDELDDTSRKNLAANSRTFGPEGSISDQTGISIFDPSLCELMYTWFSPVGGMILDPFAGGSVRGVVASKTKRNYTGVELRKEQVDANVEQGARLCDEFRPQWICGDSRQIDVHCKDVEADMVFTCPPYASLEVYSDDPADISTMDYPAFMAAYEEILAKTIGQLKEDRFACIVVGEVRDKKTGYYLGFVPDTIRAMQKAGCHYYNEIILVTAIGSLPLRAAKAFNASRKIGKTHQNVLVFVKGNPKKATEACGQVELNLDEARIGADE